MLQNNVYVKNQEEFHLSLLISGAGKYSNSVYNSCWFYFIHKGCWENMKPKDEDKKKLRKCFEKPESKQQRLQRQTDCAKVITSLYKSDRWLYCIVLSIMTQSSYSTRGDLGKGQSRWNYGKALRAWSPLHLLYAHNVLVHTS